MASFETRHGCTPQEFHRKHAFPPGARCEACSSRHPALRCIVLAPLDEAVKRGMVPGEGLLTPEIAATLVQIREPSGPKHYTRLSVTFACAAHASALKKAAAKSPSWCIVEFAEGPNPTERVSVAVS